MTWTVEKFYTRHPSKVVLIVNIRIQPFKFAGSKLEIWTATEVSQEDHIALLVCVAENGYHSLATYTWQKDGEYLRNENHPLLYVNTVGKFECTVSASSQKIKQLFMVQGEIRRLS